MSKSTKIGAAQLQISLGVLLLEIHQLGCDTALSNLAESNLCFGLFSRAVGLRLSNRSAEPQKQLHRPRAGPCSPRSFGQAFCRENMACLPHCCFLFWFWMFCPGINEETEQPHLLSEASRWLLAQSHVERGTAEFWSSSLVTEARLCLCFFRKCSPKPRFSLSLLLWKVLIP